MYESQKLLAEYLLFHYATTDEIAPPADIPHTHLHFPVRTVGCLVSPHLDPTNPPNTALDLGCAVGRSSFELARHARHVTGIDFSRSFITAAESLRTTGSLTYHRLDEGHLTTQLTVRRPPGIDPDRITFTTGDATALPDDLGPFDVLHAANLICRLPDPEKFLARLPSLVSPGGLLALTTPCTWLGEFTPPEKWPDKPTVDWLHDHLAPHFDHLETLDLPFLIRETARKFQRTTALGSTWRRKA